MVNIMHMTYSENEIDIIYIKVTNSELRPLAL